MPPISADVNGLILTYINSNNVMIFSKTTCTFCTKVKDLFQSLKVAYQSIDLDKLDNGKEIQDRLFDMTGQRTVPSVFIRGSHVGGADNTFQAHTENKLMSLVSPPTTDYNFDLVVIGGGSGGLAASKEAASFGKKVAVCDFVKPSPIGTSWGLGGTCVNVGCIPKKLMHQAAVLGESLKDARHYGWEFSEEVEHKWETLRKGVQDHIGSLNWGYRVALRDKSVTYQNSYAEFVDSHTIKVVNRRGKESTLTADKFIIATGMRPRYPDIPGAREFTITSDDLFSLPYCPGKTLCVGASYVSLECAGFLAGMGLDVTVMVRSILLRGFDQEIAERIGMHMEKHSVRFIRKTVPTRIERIQEGTPPTLRVFYNEDGAEKSIDVNTVLMAIGRDACTTGIGLENVGVMLNNKNGQILANNEQTNISNIYAIGDIVEGKPELTPVAIQAGILLARRMFAGSDIQCDYMNVPTTVFTPLEYGCCGLAEEDAIKLYGEDNIEVYHTNYMPLEYTVAGRDATDCYAKLICNKAQQERVVGLHILGPNAGEVTQGYAVAMKCGATKQHFDSTIGIHPTVSELFTTLSVTRRSGEDIAAKGC